MTINLSKPSLAALEKLTDRGFYPSRSEAIRVALRDFLAKELETAKKLQAIQKDGRGRGGRPGLLGGVKNELHVE